MSTIIRDLLTRWRFQTDAGKVQAFNAQVTATKVRAGQATSSIASLTMGMRTLTGVATRVAGVFTGGMFGATAWAAGNLEDALRDTMTMTGSFGQEYSRLYGIMKDRSIELSNTLGISAAAIARTGFYQALSTGAQAGSEGFNQLTETALKFTKVVGGDVGGNIESLNDTANAFGMGLAATGDVADKFFKASMLGSTTVPQLVMAMREAAPTAAAAGQSIAETTAILTAFANKGVKGAWAGTAYRMMLVKLQNPADEAVRWLKKLDVAIFDNMGRMRPMLDILRDMQKGMNKLSGAEQAAAMKALVGEEAFSKLAGLLTNNMDTISDWRGQLEVAGGTLDTVLKEKMKSPIEQFNQMKEAARNSAIAIGEELLPALTNVMGKSAEWLRESKSEASKVGKGFAEIGSVLWEIVRGPMESISSGFSAMWNIEKMLEASNEASRLLGVMKEIVRWVNPLQYMGLIVRFFGARTKYQDMIDKAKLREYSAEEKQLYLDSMKNWEARREAGTDAEAGRAEKMVDRYRKLLGLRPKYSQPVDNTGDISPDESPTGKAANPYGGGALGGGGKKKSGKKSRAAADALSFLHPGFGGGSPGSAWFDEWAGSLGTSRGARMDRQLSDWLGGRELRGAAAVNQDNRATIQSGAITINVTGASDPAATAREVEARLSRSLANGLGRPRFSVPGLSLGFGELPRTSFPFEG